MARSRKTIINRATSDVLDHATALLEEVSKHSYLGQFVSKRDKIAFAKGRAGVNRVIGKLDRALDQLKRATHYGSRYA